MSYIFWINREIVRSKTGIVFVVEENATVTGQVCVAESIDKCLNVFFGELYWKNKQTFFIHSFLLKCDVFNCHLKADRSRFYGIVFFSKKCTSFDMLSWNQRVVEQIL